MRYLKTLLIVGAGAAGACASPVPTGDVLIVDDSTIEFRAHVDADSFDGGAMAGYHLIVWSGGAAADHSLFVADVSDVQIIDALEQLGAVPGDALAIDSWEAREDPDSAAPDLLIEGPPVTLEFILPDGTTLGLGDVVEDPGGRGFDMRFGGHRANIPEWHSGCVVCLYSCPGSKVGNAAYTVRDFVQGATHFAVNHTVLPPDGTEIRIRIRIASEDVA